MSRFSSLGTSKHDSSDSNTPYDNSSPSGNASRGYEDYPTDKSTQASPAHPRDTYDPFLRHDVAQSLESMSFHSPSWDIGSLPSVSYSSTLSPHISLPHSMTPGEPSGGAQAAPKVTLLGGDGDLEGLDFDIVPASPVEPGEAMWTELLDQPLFQTAHSDPTWDSRTHKAAALHPSHSTPNPSTSVIMLERGSFPFPSASRSLPESLGDLLGQGHARRSSSGTRSGRGAEIWSEVASVFYHRSSPYPSPHTSPHRPASSLSDEDPNAGSSGGLLRVNSARSGHGLPEMALLSSPSTVVERADTLVKHQVATSNVARANEFKRKRPKKLQCDICGDGFTTKVNLESHIRSHLGVRPFVCKWPACGKTFTRRYDHNRHVKRRHEGAGHPKLHELSGSVGGSENEVSEYEEMDAAKVETEVEGLDVTEVEAGVGGVDVTKVEVETDVKEERKASTSGVHPSPLLDTRGGDTPMDSLDLPTDTKYPRAPSVTTDSLITIQSSEQSDTPVKQAHEAATRTPTTTEKLKTPAVGDRVPFTLKSRHLSRYIVTMSAEQQEALDIEMAQRRLRERNARKRAAALGASRS